MLDSFFNYIIFRLFDIVPMRYILLIGAVLIICIYYPDTSDSESVPKHNYRYVISDDNWAEANDKAQKAGGYLAHIESKEEFEKIVSGIEEFGYSNIHFYIGGKRDLETYSSKYYWIDYNNLKIGNSLNNSEYDWLWMDNEPSYRDDKIVESVLAIHYYEKAGKWVCNDVSNDIVADYADESNAINIDYSGKVGYIIESE